MLERPSASFIAARVALKTRWAFAAEDDCRACLAEVRLARSYSNRFALNALLVKASALLRFKSC